MGEKGITPHFGIAVYDAESGEKEERFLMEKENGFFLKKRQKR